MIAMTVTSARPAMEAAGTSGWLRPSAGVLAAIGRLRSRLGNPVLRGRRRACALISPQS